MRLPTTSLILSCLFCILFTTKEISCGDLQITSEDDQCGAYCSKTYSAHTNEKSRTEDSCKQGCRLFSIISAVEKMKADRDGVGEGNGRDSENFFNETLARNTCLDECAEAYSDKIFKEACRDGCQNQTVFKTGRISMVVDDSNPLYPFASKLIQDAMGKFADVEQHMKSQMENFKKWFQQDTHFPFFDDNERMLGSSKSNDNDDPMDEASSSLFKVFQSVADRMGKLVVDEPIDNDDDDIISKVKTPRLLGGPEDVGDHIPNHGRPLVATGRPANHKQGSEFEGPTVVGNSDENGEPVIIVQMIPSVMVGSDMDDDEDEGVVANEPSPPTQGDVMYADADDGWLACLARRTQNLSVMSRWLLCASLMLSILCMFWLCLALTRNQRFRRRRLYMQYNEAGKSDVVYFMPPPVYEKCPSSASYIPLGKDEEKMVKIPQTPPPAYENTTDIPKTEK